jgi:hydrogenase maturation protease
MEIFHQSAPPPPVLVLGVGNMLLGDDGVGPALLRRVSERYGRVRDVECVDGGTQGLALLGYLAERTTLVVLDAYSSGTAPGEVTVLNKSELLSASARRASTAHEGNVGELLAVAHLVGELPEQVFLVGVEPERVRTELGLSANVEAALPAACACACQIIEQAMRELAGPSSRSVPSAI